MRSELVLYIIYPLIFLGIFLIVFAILNLTRACPPCMDTCPECRCYPEPEKIRNLFITYDRDYLTMYHGYVVSKSFEVYMPQEYVDSTYEIKIKAENECLNQTRLCAKGNYSLRFDLPLPEVASFDDYWHCWDITNLPVELCDWNSHRVYMEIKMLDEDKNNTVHFELVE